MSYDKHLQDFEVEILVTTLTKVSPAYPNL
jgi:hypothetical protein